MKLSGRKIILLALLGVLVVGGLGVAIYYWRAKTAVANYRKQLIAAGEKLAVKELIPPVPAKEEDGAELFHSVRAKIALFTKDILSTNPPSFMKMVTPGKAMVGWQQPEIQGVWATNTWDDLAVTLDGIVGSTRGEANHRFQIELLSGFHTAASHAVAHERCFTKTRGSSFVKPA